MTAWNNGDEGRGRRGEGEKKMRKGLEGVAMVVAGTVLAGSGVSIAQLTWVSFVQLYG